MTLTSAFSDSDDDDAMGALIYNSSHTAKKIQAEGEERKDEDSSGDSRAPSVLSSAALTQRSTSPPPLPSAAKISPNTFCNDDGQSNNCSNSESGVSQVVREKKFKCNSLSPIGPPLLEGSYDYASLPRQTQAQLPQPPQTHQYQDVLHLQQQQVMHSPVVNDHINFDVHRRLMLEHQHAQHQHAILSGQHHPYLAQFVVPHPQQQHQQYMHMHQLHLEHQMHLGHQYQAAAAAAYSAVPVPIPIPPPILDPSYSHHYWRGMGVVGVGGNVTVTEQQQQQLDLEATLQRVRESSNPLTETRNPLVDKCRGLFPPQNNFDNNHLSGIGMERNNDSVPANVNVNHPISMPMEDEASLRQRIKHSLNPIEEAKRLLGRYYGDIPPVPPPIMKNHDSASNNWQTANIQEGQGQVVVGGAGAVSTSSSLATPTTVHNPRDLNGRNPTIENTPSSKESDVLSNIEGQRIDVDATFTSDSATKKKKHLNLEAEGRDTKIASSSSFKYTDFSKCWIDGCANEPVNNGLCHMHGDPKPRGFCSHKGCAASIPAGRNVCLRHEEASRLKLMACSSGSGSDGQCLVDGCAKAPISASGLCRSHSGSRGAKANRCNHKGCSNQAQENNNGLGLCSMHILKAKCAHKGCKNAPIKKGLCSQHGVKKRTEATVCHVPLRRLKKTRDADFINNFVPKKRKISSECLVAGCTNMSAHNSLCCLHGAKQSVRRHS